MARRVTAVVFLCVQAQSSLQEIAAERRAHGVELGGERGTWPREERYHENCGEPIRHGRGDVQRNYVVHFAARRRHRDLPNAGFAKNQALERAPTTKATPVIMR
jgi:hypothetical protein